MLGLPEIVPLFTGVLGLYRGEEATMDDTAGLTPGIAAGAPP
jgi:hypothetical protein